MVVCLYTGSVGEAVWLIMNIVLFGEIASERVTVPVCRFNRVTECCSLSTVCALGCPGGPVLSVRLLARGRQAYCVRPLARGRQAYCVRPLARQAYCVRPLARQAYCVVSDR